MAKALRPQLKKFYQFIQTKNEGEIVSELTIQDAAGWEPATLDAHRLKNALVPFLIYLGKGKGYRVRRDGGSISQEEIGRAFTQIRPTELILSPGARLSGELGDYELVTEIGRGAVAQVWQCFRVLNRKPGALKIVSPRADLLEPSMFDDVKHRFSRETKNGRALSHSHVVAHTDRGSFKSHPFLVMELADRSVGAALKDGTLPPAETLHIVESCALGLQYLHGLGCIHRDVKPDNMLYFGNRVVLGDLGIVNWSHMNPAFTSAGTITKASIQLGAGRDMAPEQRRVPHEAVAQSDIYSLGISWYEMLTNTTPDPAAVGAQAFDDPSTNAAVNSAIRRMLMFRPEDRPDAAALLGLLAALRTSVFPPS